MSYSPVTKVFYGPYDDQTDANYRLVPAPKISIDNTLNYANDNIVGYSYTITIKGYATALDRTQENNSIDYGLDLVVDKIDDIRRIFSLNGGILTITDADDNIILQALGGMVESVNFDQSSNNWINYSEYTAVLRFNNINYKGCTNTDNFDCANILLDTNGYNSSLIDISSYKVQSFNDNWTFNLDDNIYNTYDQFHNQYFTVEYKVSAVGQVFFQDNQLVPAWEQAKNFCQDRLYTQVVDGLIKNILDKSGNTGCSGVQDITQLHSLSTDNGVLSNLSDNTYGIFNETIDCETSESQGSFGLTYKAILKKKNETNLNLCTNNTIHTFTVQKNISDDNSKLSSTMTVQGNIQGLIPGGLVRNFTTLELPSNGTLLISHDNVLSRYEYALDAYKKITNAARDDLKADFKTLLGIDYTQFNLDCDIGEIPCSSHSSDHSYSDGTITYTTEFNNAMACLKGSVIRGVAINKKDPTPVIQEFIIPGRSLGPIIQKINTSSPRTISLSINGVSNELKCCFDPASIVSDICSDIDSRLLPASGLPTATISGLVLTSHNYNTNPIDGSFSIQREYTCYNS